MPSPALRARGIALAIPSTLIVLAACGNEPKLPPMDPAAHKADVDTWKATRLKTVTTPGRPLFYTGLRWLKQGANTGGGDTTSAVVLPGRGVPAHVGVLTRTGNDVSFTPDPHAKVTIDSQPAKAGPLRTDANGANPSV